MAMPGSGRGGDGPADLGDDGDFESELALIDGDERLPWLESDDELDEQGVDTGRVVAFALLGLIAVLLIVGTLWLVLRDKSGGRSRSGRRRTAWRPIGEHEGRRLLSTVVDQAGDRDRVRRMGGA